MSANDDPITRIITQLTPHSADHRLRDRVPRGEEPVVRFGPGGRGGARGGEGGQEELGVG